ncbi:hypothetical protein ARMGADRAFT_766037 [Armillaria gallica]|uniref:Uncharacterized protein n=1 Tax=Armillaria gallica TaxID=47427 RepID=A0A2H3CFV8_ARMGA|nr:hypothetical protein ARMGADRAFT_765227 [Armillaria gallica]PBK81962.1 hypothetical protein ARMGADRAFT_766037 [Armillaria gallica]
MSRGWLYPKPWIRIKGPMKLTPVNSHAITPGFQWTTVKETPCCRNHRRSASQQQRSRTILNGRRDVQRSATNAQLATHPTLIAQAVSRSRKLLKTTDSIISQEPAVIRFLYSGVLVSCVECSNGLVYHQRATIIRWYNQSQ